MDVVEEEAVAAMVVTVEGEVEMVERAMVPRLLTMAAHRAAHLIPQLRPVEVQLPRQRPHPRRHRSVQPDRNS